MRVTVIGTGYVGLTTAIVMAYLGHRVTAVDKDSAKIELLRAGKSPIHENGLEPLLREVGHRIRFTTSIPDAIRDTDVILIAVGTPSKKNGEADTHFVEEAAQEVAEGLSAGGAYTLVVKSTVPIGTNRRVMHVVERTLVERSASASIYVASNPEFLREGLALRDSFYPDRIVIGADHHQAVDDLRRLYQPILEQTFTAPRDIPRPDGYALPPLITTDPVSAEMIKYAANAFLALKISFINEIAGLCERVDGDVTEVARGIGLDPRIGQRFLQAGLGWGGSCFPKDTAALIAMGAEYGYEMPIVMAAREVNWQQRQRLIHRLQEVLKVLRGRTIALLGIAFKPNTDDIREAPSMDIIRALLDRGAHVRAHDPAAIPNARKALEGSGVEFVEDPYEAASGADAACIITEWEMYQHLDLRRLGELMRTPILVDGRNLLKPEETRAAGFTYVGMGR